MVNTSGCAIFLFEMDTGQENSCLCTHGSLQNGHRASKSSTLYPQLAPKWAQSKQINYFVPTTCSEMGTAQASQLLCAHGLLQSGHSASASATLCPWLAPKWAQHKRISYSVPMARSKTGTEQAHQLLCTHGLLQSGHSASASATLYPRLAPKWAQRKRVSYSVPTARSKTGTAQESHLLCTRGLLQNGLSASASATLCPWLSPKWAQRKRIIHPVPTACSKMGTAQAHQLLCTHGLLQSGHSVGIIRVCAPNLSNST